MTIVREGHAYAGRTLAAISSIRRRGVLLLLVSLPDGSRSLVPATWTSWEGGHNGGSPSGDNGKARHCLAKLGDLLHLRKVIDALHGRHVESVPHSESRRAIESGLSQPARSSTEPPFSKAAGLGPTRRSPASGGPRYPRTPHRPHAHGITGDGGK